VLEDSLGENRAAVADPKNTNEPSPDGHPAEPQGAADSSPPT